MRLSDVPRQKLLEVLTHLYGEAVYMQLPVEFLDSIDAQLSTCVEEYNESNKRKSFSKGNDRYVGSLPGEVACYIRALHLWKTLPPWMNVEVTHDKEQQVNQCVDLIVDGKITEQVKSGNEGTSSDIYYHSDWLKGTPQLIVAVCWQKHVFHVNKREEWERLAKQYDKWIDRDAFLEKGTVEPIHSDIVQLVEELL